MNLPKKRISSRSTIGLNKVFAESDIYFIKDFPTVGTFPDIGTGVNQVRLRHKWLYGGYGFYPGIREYKTFRRRVDEFTYYGDYLHTLRQKISIVHSLIECDLDTDLPVHCSIKPVDISKTSVVDFLDIKSVKQLSIIFHPGQTRAQGSAFLGDNLKNVLMFINKKYSPLINFKNIELVKIESIQDLIQYYKVQNEEQYSELEYDFYIPGDVDGIRYHTENETGVLKCNNIYTVRQDQTRPDSVHSSKTYPIDTFINMDKYCRRLFNNRLNIYTNQDIEKLIDQNLKVRKHLTTEALDLDIKKDSSKYREIMRTQESYQEVEFQNNHYSSYFTKHREHLIAEAKYLSKEEVEYTLLADYYRNVFEEKASDLNFNYISTDSVKEYDWYVSNNNYKGICIVTNTLSCTRDFAELFMCIPVSFPLIRNQEGTITVINCEHEYWKTGKGYKEYVFNQNFFNEWKQ